MVKAGEPGAGTSWPSDGRNIEINRSSAMVRISEESYQAFRK